MIPGSILSLVYRAPTTLTAEQYAAQGRAQVAALHGCPAKADSVAEVAVTEHPGGATPSRAAASWCRS